MPKTIQLMINLEDLRALLKGDKLYRADAIVTIPIELVIPEEEELK